MEKYLKIGEKWETFQNKKHRSNYRKIRIWGKSIDDKKIEKKMKNKKIEKETKQNMKKLEKI